MGSLTFVGLGLGPKGISIEGLEELRKADEVFLEYYTTPHDPSLISELEKGSGRHLTVVDREYVEDGKSILAEAKARRVVLAVPGDPMIATTHGELRVRAARAGIATRIVHSATVATAVASASGLHFYKFSRTVTVTRDSRPLSQVYQTLHENLLEGAHTLLLLEYDVERGEGASPNQAFRGLLDAEANFKRGVVSDGTFALVLSRLGRADEAYAAGSFSELEKRSFGGAPHSIVIPGSLHFTESEAIEALSGTAAERVHGNSENVKRTAQTLVPRYVEKTRRALESVRGRLGEQYESVVDNVELYMRDAESFLAKGDDELAMLSIGYAEGLLDSLNFSGVVKVEW
ncbi:MAG: diphthine synthase [Nitrososphaerales archaeon]|nr:diphthine synthase [Nitrososphaerales archaeon]